MVNADMFRNTVPIRPLPTMAPAQPQPQYAPQVAPMPQPAAPVYEDPEIAKLKFFFLKWLSIVIGGSAILLIVWRVALKFF